MQPEPLFMGESPEVLVLETVNNRTFEVGDKVFFASGEGYTIGEIKDVYCSLDHVYTVTSSKLNFDYYVQAQGLFRSIEELKAWMDKRFDAMYNL